MTLITNVNGPAPDFKANSTHGNCSATDLVAGAMVHQAKLSAGPAGAVLTEVEVVK